jgi:4-amino-4-deoxy-L-arabinose transferase-like glycosyltransferase
MHGDRQYAALLPAAMSLGTHQCVYASIDLAVLVAVSYRSALAGFPALNPTASDSMRASAATYASAPSDRFRQLRIDLFAVVFVTLIVSAIYGVRLTRQSLFGEETRWGTGAREMLATGDWIVPRQQGRVFSERPPMTMWMMAIAGWLRGGVDPIAIRLPSVIAVVLTSLLVFGYTRVFDSTVAATVAAIAYATMGQVLQIGRQGESEALFALLVGASLLIWHIGYARCWRPLFVWTIGFAFAALAALVKGPQAPVYFVAITSVYLTVRRDWRYLFNWQFVAGLAVFALILSAWQIPFYLATDWATVVAIWSGLAGDRIRLSGMFEHALMYPIETFACLLPWSPILFALAKRETRRLLIDQQPVITFLTTALVVAYPTVWFAAGARGRYFMPLYPLVAVLVGVVVERCASAAIGSYPRRAWHQFLTLWATFIGTSGLVIAGSGLLMTDPADRFYQPRWFAVVFALFAAAALVLLWESYRRQSHLRPIIAAVAIAMVAGACVAGVLVNVNVARWIDPADEIANLKNQLPPGTDLASFSPIEHRFVYYYGDPITEFDWPRSAANIPPELTYFCFMRQPGDTAESRAAGRGRTWYTTPGTLPIAWEELGAVCVERQVYIDEPPRTVVLGRVVRPLEATSSDVTVAPPSTAKLPYTPVRRW